MDESHINITKAILANPEVIDHDGLDYEHLWFVNEENVLYQGKIVAVKLLETRKQSRDGVDVSMTLYEFLVDYTDDLYSSEIDV